MAIRAVSGSSGSGGGVAAPGAKRVVLGSLDGTSWAPEPVGLWIPRVARPLPRRRASNATGCDSLTGVTGTAGAFSLDTANAGIGPGGAIKLTAPATVGGFNEVIVPLTGAPWSFGDGTTPTAYLRAWFMVDDDRDIARSSLAYARFNLATAAGFTNSIYQDVGSAVAGDGSPNKVRSRNTISTIVFPMLLADAAGSADMPPPPNSATHAWQAFGTGFAAADWGAVTQVKIRLSGQAPADGSAYVPPTIWLLGVERVPLPPYALMSLQFDWNMPDHARMGHMLNAQYGIQPLLNCFLNPFRGTQGSTEMTLDQLLTAVQHRHFETSIYALQNTTVPPVDGNNNFGGGTATVPGVKFSQVSQAQVEQNFSEGQAYFAEYNLSGHDMLLGQERKLRDADGEGLLRKYSSFGINPVSAEYCGWWPADNPYRHPTYMIDTTRDVVDLGAGTWGASASFQRTVRRAIRNKEWLRLLCHAVSWDGSGSGFQPAQLRALFDYATAAGRFDGTAGKVVSQSEALQLSRYAA
jgi:hypothetical protein